MAKRFNIHEWQAGRYSKKPLTEGKGSTLSISKSDMERLHKDGKIKINGHVILYKIEEDMDEASMTGTGASITTGGSEAYATPYAFKKKRNQDD